MKHARSFLLTLSIVVMFVTVPAMADWVPDDGHKMHFPQMPDPNGWDVNITADNMWDDWQCSQSGPVSDIHFWASWERGVGNEDPNQFLWIRAQIWADMPAPDSSNPNDPNPLPYSHPEAVGDPLGPLWEHYFSPSEFTMRPAGTGDQGWLDPQLGIARRPDHTEYYQINMTNIAEPFYQEEGTIYWLALHAAPVDFENQQLGWKTADLNSYPDSNTGTHFQDDAVFYFASADNPYGWEKLINPDDGESLDLAFVITPEPGTMALLAIGGLVTLLKRKRKS